MEQIHTVYNSLITSFDYYDYLNLSLFYILYFSFCMFFKFDMVLHSWFFLFSFLSDLNANLRASPNDNILYI